MGPLPFSSPALFWLCSASSQLSSPSDSFLFVQPLSVPSVYHTVLLFLSLLGECLSPFLWNPGTCSEQLWVHSYIVSSCLASHLDHLTPSGTLSLPTCLGLFAPTTLTPRVSRTPPGVTP